MSLAKINPTATRAWEKLKKHYAAIGSKRMLDWFQEEKDRGKNFRILWEDFVLDYSKNRIDGKTLDLLLELADEVKLKESIHKQFEGERINETEDRKVLHTALRDPRDPKEEILAALEKMRSFSDSVINGEWLGFSGKKITDVVNIGIGGSSLGPQMVVEALQFYKNRLNLHFISNIDGDRNAEILKNLNPETTLFIVVSKSFSTQETLSNANFFRWWLLKHTELANLAKHFVAVTSNLEKARKFGIPKKNIFPLWDWVGGRFSLWSAAGLSICCAVGFSNFLKLREGAYAMDQHFKTEDFRHNLPVILALLSIWYNNFFKTQTEAVIPYSDYLNQFVPYLQQISMESNGKSVSRAGHKVDYPTGNIIWGAVGTDAQHSFFQLIHQGTSLIPCDFIGFKESLHADEYSHDQLMANFFAQTEALLTGKTQEQAKNELLKEGVKDYHKILPFKVFEGNRPTNTLLIRRLTPRNLGGLIALYEHKIAVQGLIWNIFSFDQWGVELGKQLADSVLEEFKSDTPVKTFDSSTAELIKFYKKGKQQK